MFSKCKDYVPPELLLEVDSDADLVGFATLLQSGLYLHVDQGCRIGELLAMLPGFTEEYIAANVQTIFLNGLPADDLDQQIWGENGVLAVSAAMPGLAGAIFRKGGFHASLRTTSARILDGTATEQPVSIRLKLFNMIAKDRGVQILHQGCEVRAAALRKFLGYRSQLASHIGCAVTGQGSLDSGQLATFLNASHSIHLRIRKKT